MKIALICPSNIIYMPYVKNYEEIFASNNDNYTIINWDRFKIEDSKDANKYRDNKIGHQRNYFDYFTYKKFIEKRLKKEKYDKIIIFGLQLAYFLRKILQKDYKNKYIIDVRDYNKILSVYRPTKLFASSYSVVISSPGYKKWLPKQFEYIVNHNIIFNELKSLENFKLLNNNHQIKISYIGMITNLKENLSLINLLKNKKSFYIIFHGEGTINSEIESYMNENNIVNVSVSGRYEKKNENQLYHEADFINMFLYDNSLNNSTCLSNRLYNAAANGKPLLTLKGTYLAEEIQKYNLGLVIETLESLEEELLNYIKNFNEKLFLKGRSQFFEKVQRDNENFVKEIESFRNS